MQITDKKPLLLEVSKQAYSSQSTSDLAISTVKSLAHESTSASNVTISDAAREAEHLPRYLQPVKGYANPHASSGSVYDFLKPSDQKILKEAYDYALHNGTSLEKVEEAAFYLGIHRNKQSRIATGTTYSTYIPEQSKAFLSAKPENRASELDKLLQEQPNNKFFQTLKRAEEGSFFGTDNPVLNHALFMDAVDDHLGIYRSGSISTDTGRKLFDHLSESDNSALSKAYQEARDSDLDPEEVKKAGFLLAIERLTESMIDENSMREKDAQALSLLQSKVNTPNGLIELAEQVLGKGAADSFRQMVGQPFSEEVFGQNSMLRQALFLKPAYSLLNMTLIPQSP